MASERKIIDEAQRKARMDQQELDIRERLQHIKHKLLVMSGKGGVGKKQRGSLPGCLPGQKGV